MKSEDGQRSLSFLLALVRALAGRCLKCDMLGDLNKQQSSLACIADTPAEID